MDRKGQVADYKGTINLPETGFPMKADLAQREPKMLAKWESQQPVREDPRHLPGASAFRAARRPAVCERGAAPRALPQQGAQGHRGQVAFVRRLRLALRARLGLPRAAHRTPGREETRARRRETQRQGIPRRLPQVRWRTGEPAARGVQTLRRAGRLGSPLHDHGSALRSSADPRAGPHHPQRTLL